MNFRQLDLNLLRVLGALHRTRSVTGAGKLLSLSQPATSNALARLRHVFDDELFVRTPAGLVATPLCQRIAPAVQGQLAELESLFSGQQAFDPAHGDADWRLSLSDLGEMMFLPPLAAALRARHFGALPDLTLRSDLLAIVPEMYARNLRQPEEFSVWQLPHAPTYEVRLVWHTSTDLEPGQQWLRALIRSLFARPA